MTVVVTIYVLNLNMLSRYQTLEDTKNTYIGINGNVLDIGTKVKDLMSSLYTFTLLNTSADEVQNLIAQTYSNLL